MNIEGCVHLLREKEPTALLGSLIGWVEQSGLGWVQVGTFHDNKNAKVTLLDNQVSLRLSFDTALSFAGWLLCLCNQNTALE